MKPFDATADPHMSVQIRSHELILLVIGDHDSQIAGSENRPSHPSSKLGASVSDTSLLREVSGIEYRVCPMTMDRSIVDG